MLLLALAASALTATQPMPAQRAVPRHPLQHYAARADYPAAALRDRAEGRTAIALGIGPDGRVFNCTITASSGSAALDSTTCRLMRSRARFAPARDANGIAVPDRVEGALTWRLPRD